MKKILVLNCGSSSIKYRLFDKDFNTILHGLVERIGKNAELIHFKGKERLKKKVDARTHKKGIKLMIKLLHDREWGAIKRVTEISVVGHRVVHGGQMAETAVVSDVALGYLDDFKMLAPLHNPKNITGIQETKKEMPTVPQVMVFDTEFHQTMPRKAYMYGLPYNYFDKYAVRKYGFHGTSHKYVAQEAAKMLKKKKPNLITCHLGAGSSLTAVKKGKSVDTSMGMTPLEGVMMATRTGDIDPSVLDYLVKKYGFEYEGLFDTMNHKSGLLGISGVSKDVRVIEGRAKKGNERCKLALEMFAYRVAKYIGSYAVALGEVDAVVFTAGIGENSASMRKQICTYLKILGINLDLKKNRKNLKKAREITSPGSEIKVLVIPTNEELMIAKEAAKAVGASK
ncbi:acetate/propionate family kinase [Candidatus Micrarchaeota archaeon]|nr:acetate/propionate family kinase [Candidatus Micrarchaeota archaeon]MBD3418433.1 acetate/propionate family kinase [Candidatus Micrarchaeota archaeon]